MSGTRTTLWLVLLAGAGALLASTSAAWACVALASLEVSPSVVQPGQEVEFEGSYYHDAAPVVLRWDSLDGPVVATVPAEALADFLHGHWRNLAGRFTVPADAAAGSHLVLATQDGAPGRPTWGVPARTIVRVGGAGVAPGEADDRTVGRATGPPPTRVNAEQGASPRTYAPGDVVVDPGDADTLYAASVELRSRRCNFRRSRDGGRSWTTAASPSPPSHPFCSHTEQFMPMGALAVGGDGAVYYLHRGWSHQDEGPEANAGVFLARSDDGGDTWRSTPVRDTRGFRAPDNELNFPTDVAVDSGGDDDVVYVTWTTTSPSAVPARPPQPMLAVSLDGGRTFSAPRNVAGSFFDDTEHITGDIPAALAKRENFGGTTPYLAVDGRGGLAVSWIRRIADAPLDLAQPRYLTRSTDRGLTFSVTEMAPASTINGAGAVLAWTPAGGAAGTFHAVYEDRSPTSPADQGDRDIHYRRSTDNGRTWSTSKVINDDDPAQLFTQLLPTIATAPDGRLDVAWWDTRDGVEIYATDVYYSSSPDAGLTWSANQRLTDRSVSRRFGSWVDNFGDTRQTPALASSDASATVVWDDTRLGDERSGLQDLYAAAVRHQPLSGRRTSPVPLYIGAGVVGATLAALAVMAMRRRRRVQVAPPVAS